MPEARPARTGAVLAAPEFRELVSARGRLRGCLSVLTLLMFFGFLALISLGKDALGTSVPGGNVPMGLVIALAMIVSVVGLTGLYVHQSNGRFDVRTRALQQEFGR